MKLIEVIAAVLLMALLWRGIAGSCVLYAEIKAETVEAREALYELREASL